METDRSQRNKSIWKHQSDNNKTPVFGKNLSDHNKIPVFGNTSRITTKRKYLQTADAKKILAF